MPEFDLTKATEAERLDHLKSLSADPNFKKNTKKSLSKEESYFVSLMDFRSKRNKLLEEESKFLLDFLDKNMGNMDLNSRLNSLQVKENKDRALWVGFLKRYTFATRDMEAINSASKKLDDARLALEKNTNCNDKLNLSEYHKLETSRKLSQEFESINNSYLDMSKNSNLYNFRQQALLIKTNLDVLDKKIQSEMKLESGDVLFANIRREAKFREKKLSFMDKMQERFAKFGHVSKVVFKDVNGQKQFNNAHLYEGKYKFDQVNISQYLYSDILHVDLTKLISQENQEKLDQQDPNWKVEIRNKYNEIENQIHQDAEKFSKTKVTVKKIANVIKDNLFSLNQKKAPRENFDKVHDKIFNGGYGKSSAIDKNKEMLCSSFVARETVASLVELDKFINKKYGISNSIDFPFEKNIKLGQILPGRLYDILTLKGVFVPFERTETEKKIFDFAYEKKQKLEVKEDKQALLNLILDEVSKYKADIISNPQEALKKLSDSIEEKISEFVVRKSDENAIVIDANSQKIIQEKTASIVDNLKKQENRNIIIKIIYEIMALIAIKKKKSSIFIGEIEKISKNIEVSVLKKKKIKYQENPLLNSNIKQKNKTISSHLDDKRLKFYNKEEFLKNNPLLKQEKKSKDKPRSI